MPFGIPKGAMCVQRFDDSLEFCNSHYLSHFAAFFIDARAKRSVVESCTLVLVHTISFRYIQVCVNPLPAKASIGQRFTKGDCMKVTNVHMPEPAQKVTNQNQ